MFVGREFTPAVYYFIVLILGNCISKISCFELLKRRLSRPLFTPTPTPLPPIKGELLLEKIAANQQFTKKASASSLFYITNYLRIRNNRHQFFDFIRL